MFIDFLLFRFFASRSIAWVSLCVPLILPKFFSRETICKLALFEHLAEALAQFEVTLGLGALDELFELVGAGLRRLLGLLLVHGLSLVRLSLVWLTLVRLSLVRLLVRDVRPGRLRVSSTGASGHGVANSVPNRRAHSDSSGCARHLSEHARLSGCCSWSTHS